MDGKELRKEMLELIKKVPVICKPQVFERPITELRGENAPEDLAWEYEYTRTYRALVDVIDQITVGEKTISDEQLEKFASTIDLLHSYKDQCDLKSDENKLEYLKQMMDVRKLVIESGVSTLPILRAVHQVEGLSSKEKSIANKISERDQLSLVVMQLEKEVSEREKQLSEVCAENRAHLIESQHLTKQLLDMTKTPQLSEEDKTTISRLHNECDRLLLQSQKYAEIIESTIVENGLDWMEDKRLRTAMELSGTVNDERSW